MILFLKWAAWVHAVQVLPLVRVTPPRHRKGWLFGEWQTRICLLLSVLTLLLLSTSPVLKMEERGGEGGISEPSYSLLPSLNRMIPKAPEPPALSEQSLFGKRPPI